MEYGLHTGAQEYGFENTRGTAKVSPSLLHPQGQEAQLALSKHLLRVSVDIRATVNIHQNPGPIHARAVSTVSVARSTTYSTLQLQCPICKGPFPLSSARKTYAGRAHVPAQSSPGSHLLAECSPGPPPGGCEKLGSAPGPRGRHHWPRCCH